MEFRIISISGREGLKTIIFELFPGQLPAQYPGSIDYLGDTFYRGMYLEDNRTLEFVTR